MALDPAQSETRCENLGEGSKGEDGAMGVEGEEWRRWGDVWEREELVHLICDDGETVLYGEIHDSSPLLGRHGTAGWVVASWYRVEHLGDRAVLKESLKSAVHGQSEKER